MMQRSAYLVKLLWAWKWPWTFVAQRGSFNLTNEGNSTHDATRHFRHTVRALLYS